MALSKIPSDLLEGAVSFNSAAPADSLTIDASGNVGIGTSSPSSQLHLDTSSGDQILTLEGTSRTWMIRNQSDGNLGVYDSTAAAWRTFIDTSGNLLVGKTSTGATAAGVQIYPGGTSTAITSSDTSTTGPLLYLVNSGSSVTSGYRFVTFRATSSFTQVGTISTNGTSTTSYNTTSDYRLKENVMGVTGAAARVQQLNPVRFNFISDPDTTVDGFLAHEVQDVVPEAITGTKDAVDAEGNPEYQGIDQSKLVPLLTAALQEALTEITSLKARVAALEAA